MVYALVLCILGAFAAGGHRLAARLLKVRGVPFLSKQLQAEAFNSSRARRIAVRGAGPLAAYVVLVTLNVPIFASSGALTTHVQVTTNSPAESAGLRSGDRITSMLDEPVREFDQLRGLVQQNPKGRLPVQVERGGEVLSFVVIPDEQGRIGVQPTGERLPVSFFALLGTTVKPLQDFATSLRLLWDYVAGTAPETIFVSGSTAVVGDGSIPVGLWLTMVVATTGSVVWPLILLHALTAAVVGERRRAGTSPQVSMPGA